MRGYKAIITALAVTVAMPALAQGIPVFDASSYIQSLQQVLNSGQQLTQGVTQIQQTLGILKQAQQTYASLSKLTNASSVAALLNNPAIRNILPPGVTDMTTLLSGNTQNTGALGQLATQFQQQYKLPDTAADGTNYSAGVNAAYANYLKSMTGGAATSMALGSNTLSIGTQRTLGLGQLQSQLDTAQDPKDVLDLQVRATIENAQATNDLMKLQAIQMSMQAQSDLLEKQYSASRNRAANAALAAALIPAGH